MSLHRAIPLLLLIACGSSGGDTERPRTFGGDRPVTLQVPGDFDAAKQYPLVMILHGYSANAFTQQAYFGMTSLANDREALVVAPDGTVDASGNQFWNADSTCCDFGHLNPDDVGYLGGLLDDIAAAWPVDPQAVYVLGHSNGAWMAYRMACERADAISSIVVLAGNASVGITCAPAHPVNVLHLHGTADTTVPYSETSVDTWAGLDTCTGTRAAGATLDLDATLAGPETQMSSTGGCPGGGAVDLWKIEGAGHIPNLTAAFEPSVWPWLLDHPRPPPG